MDARTRRLTTAFAVVAVLLLLLGVVAWAFTDVNGHERATVTVADANGTTLGVVNASVADSEAERYRGLSGTQSLANGTGMLFVYGAESERTFVMREMNYPIDMVFVGADGRITRVFHAETEERPYEQYTARAKWVLEVPYGWTTRHGVEAGDRVRVTYGA
ncbi:DUF192 domain-containing protein [Halarchaeum sp. P4]|uniref:DUF192 domain-containing protein n=1 Tax=Halarchaeum sp. P4 TaxID=3421639 RepID=UPI003EBAB35A